MAECKRAALAAVVTGDCWQPAWPWRPSHQEARDELTQWLQAGGVDPRWFLPTIAGQLDEETWAERQESVSPYVESHPPDTHLWIGYHLPTGLRRWLEASGRAWISLSRPPLKTLDWMVCLETNVPGLAGQPLLWEHCAPRVGSPQSPHRCVVIFGTPPLEACRVWEGVRETYGDQLDVLVDLHGLANQVHYFPGAQRDEEAEMIMNLTGTTCHRAMAAPRLFNLKPTTVASFDPFFHHIAEIFEASFTLLGAPAAAPVPLLFPARRLRQAAFWGEVFARISSPEYLNSPSSCQKTH